MKILFIYPFCHRTGRSPLKWLPMGASTLIGNIKSDFPNVNFFQIDLEREIESAILENKISKSDFDSLKDFINNSNPEKLIKESSYLNQEYRKIKKFLSLVDRLFSLKKYNHYFFTANNRDKLGISANVLLAKYLKNKYGNKKNIFGGIYAFGDDYTKHSFENMGFFDSFVVGTRGENAAKRIIMNLLTNKKLKKIYQGRNVSPKNLFLKSPDFKTLLSFKRFIHFPKNLENLYQTKLPGSKIANPILFLPYRFSIGCFWGKCSYCSNSSCISSEFYQETNSKIVNKIKEFKKKYRTKYFVFFNNNFNSDLTQSKKLLKSFIENNLNILWTDCFNLRFIDDELIDLMKKAGCFRVDVGTNSYDPEIQKRHNDIFRNKYLENLKKISQNGIWVHVNLIANLPYQYSVKNDKIVLRKYIKYIDSVTLNSYRRYFTSDLTASPKKYGIKSVDYSFRFKDRDFFQPYIEKEFGGKLKDRQKMFARNYTELEDFFLKNKKPLNQINLYLLGYLYNTLWFENKDKINKIVTKGSYQKIKK